MMCSHIVLLATLLGQVLATPVARAAHPSVMIASGVVVGTATSLPSATVSVNRFLGIPFAQSPPERFSPPTDPSPWTKPLDVFAFKDACVQQFNYPESTRNFTMTIFNNPGGPPPVESEDCLYLNVFAPCNTPPPEGFPVMFWLFGGDLQFGTAGISPYDGSSFAAHQQVIVVTTNYRTNAFGFSNSPQIPVGQQNSGFLDQRKALQWVQSNIAKFGGNKSKVTIFGESAGGYSVKQLLAVPPKPLNFRGAILESEAASFTGSGSASWEALVTTLGCATASSQIDCVRGKPATSIKNIIEMNMLDFPPAYDGVTAVEDVRPSILLHTAAQVPILIGTNANEGRVFITALGIGPDAGEPVLAAFLNATFPGQTALQKEVVAAYPSAISSVPYLLASQVLTDYEFLCPAAELADLVAASGNNAWRYYFNATFPNTQLFPEAGAYHSTEISEVFGTYPTKGETTQEVLLSQYMQTAWADFAKNPSAGPGWPRLGSNNGVELGDLGGNGTYGEKTIPLAQVDDICLVYAPLIAASPL